LPRAGNTDVHLEESVCVAKGVAGLGFHRSVPQLLHSTRTAALYRLCMGFDSFLIQYIRLLKEVFIE
jgi:hypothetical protein